MSAPRLGGAGFAGSGLTLWTCTGIGTWTALVDGRGFVAEMGGSRPFQPYSCKHFESRAYSGAGVHRPRLSGTFAPRRNRERGARPLLERYILYRRGERRSAVCEWGRAGVAALAPVSWWAVRLPTRTGEQSRALRAALATSAETGPCWRARVTALQAGWLTLAPPAARVSARGQLRRRVALRWQLRRQGAAAEAESPDQGGCVRDGQRRRWKGPLATGLIPVQFLSVSCPMDVNDLGRTAPKPLRGHWPGPDTGCVVWLFQRFHCPETWGRDPCSPGPAP